MHYTSCRKTRKLVQLLCKLHLHLHNLKHIILQHTNFINLNTTSLQKTKLNTLTQTTINILNNPMKFELNKLKSEDLVIFKTWPILTCLNKIHHTTKKMKNNKNMLVLRRKLDAWYLQNNTLLRTSQTLHSRLRSNLFKL